MAAYSKFFTALIGAIVAGLSIFGITLDFLTPEMQATLVSFITAILVYFIPNKTE